MSEIDVGTSNGMYQALFEKMPIIGFVVDADMRVIAVTDRLLGAVPYTRESLVGRDVFEAFPDNPDDPDADGTTVLRTSLERAFASGLPEKLPLQRYDAPPAEPGGVFEERYWLPENIPVHDNGRVAYVIHTVVDARAGVDESAGA